MPTPFYHLSIAYDLLRGNCLDIRVKKLLIENQEAFFLGVVAPDVQTLSGQTRVSTHFFDLPVKSNCQTPWKNIITCYPEYSKFSDQSPVQASFLAGYLCHLLADWEWVKDIFIPVFGLHSNWGDFPYRLYLHNVLGAYLDRELLSGLQRNQSNKVRLANPGEWLPFVQQVDLCNWRNFLEAQLAPGGKVFTVELLASRQGILEEQYHRLLNSEDEMNSEVFSHLPRQFLEVFYQRMVEKSCWLMSEYVLDHDILLMERV